MHKALSQLREKLPKASLSDTVKKQNAYRSEARKRVQCSTSAKWVSCCLSVSPCDIEPVELDPSDLASDLVLKEIERSTGESFGIGTQPGSSQMHNPGARTDADLAD